MTVSPPTQATDVATAGSSPVATPIQPKPTSDRLARAGRLVLAWLTVLVATLLIVLDVGWRRLLEWRPIHEHVVPAIWADVPRTHYGLPAAVAVALLVLGAPAVYRSRRVWPRPLLIAALIAASILAVVELPADFPADVPELRTAGRTVLALAAVYLLAKVVLLHRFATLWGAREVMQARDLDVLLPYQASDLSRLGDAIVSGRTDAHAQVVQFVGRWGDGKSFLLDRLDAHLGARGDTAVPCAVIRINVWDAQNEPDLHLAIVEEILGHPRYWYTYGWLRYPLSLYLARGFKEAKLAFSAGKQAKAKVELPLNAPRPTGRRTLEKLVARVAGRGVRTVVVLDEMDRADPPVAQAAVTLALRSLDMPGMVVVLSYVDEIMRYKVFNPLVECLPDLASTMRAVIYAYGPDQAVGDGAGGPLTAASNGSLATWSAWEQAQTLALPEGAKSTDKPGSGSLVSNQDCGRASAAVRLAYTYASPLSRRYVLQRRFAEKYLGTRPVQLRRLGAKDIARLVVQFDTVGSEVRRLVDDADLGAGGAVEQTVHTAFRRCYGEADVPEAPTIRLMEGELLRRLSDITKVGRTKEFVAAVVLVAYEAARLDERSYQDS